MSTTGLTVQAPGRVNLIGEHTDYNEGFVMPVAIDRHTSVRAQRRLDRLLCVSSSGFAPAANIDLDRDLDPKSVSRLNDWTRYLCAVAWALRAAGHELCGADLAIESTIPAGAGLSSSAALEVACGCALLRLVGVRPDLSVLAQVCQRAENDFVGMRCGIMDQFIACRGLADHALLLDCRSLAYEQVPLHFAGTDVRIVVCNSMVRHAHAGGEYNDRRVQCEAGVRHLQAHRPGIVALRDVTLREFATLGANLDPLLLRRCRHVISENERVQAAAAAMAAGDVAALGALMYASHVSLRDDYAVSCVELDQLVEIAKRCDGVFGARMTGGGFGGCTVNLVRADRVALFERTILEQYAAASGRAAQIFVCRASDGVRCSVESGGSHA